MRARKVEFGPRKAEGTFCGVPYDTESGCEGCDVHFFMGGIPEAEREAKLRDAIRSARNTRDVVECFWSENKPEGFWAEEHYDINGRRCPAPETAAC